MAVRAEPLCGEARAESIVRAEPLGGEARAESIWRSQVGPALGGHHREIVLPERAVRGLVRHVGDGAALGVDGLALESAGQLDPRCRAPRGRAGYGSPR